MKRYLDPKADIKTYLLDIGLPILIFYVIAVACRAIFVCVLPAFYPNGIHSIVLQLCEGLGPALGAITVMCFLKKKLYCSVVGKSLFRSLACIVLPVALFLVFDRANGVDVSLVFLGCIAYAFLEEVGWRGYLTGEFKEMSQLRRVLVVTVFWFFWHVNIPLGISGLVFFVILLVSSWGLDQFAHDTHSLVLCACLHGIFNLMKHNNGLLNNGMTISLLVVSVIAWFVIWYCPFKKKS